MLQEKQANKQKWIKKTKNRKAEVWPARKHWIKKKKILKDYVAKKIKRCRLAIRMDILTS